MPLISRVSRLFKADLHAVLDRLEEPQALLRQAIREMEELLRTDRARARRLHAELRSLDTAAEESASALARLAEELDICFESGAEDLARKLVKRKLEHERTAASLVQRRTLAGRAVADLEVRIAENGARVQTMRANAEALSDRIGESDTTWSVPGGAHWSGVSDADVDVAFLSEKRKRGAA